MNSRASSPARTLICDLDGTLVDSAPDMAAALGELLAELEALFGAVPGLAIEGHLESTGTDFTGNVNTVYALKARRKATA